MEITFSKYCLNITIVFVISSTTGAHKSLFAYLLTLFLRAAGKNRYPDNQSCYTP